MCGIAGFYLKRPNVKINLEKLTDELLNCIDSRGGDATGIAAFGAEGCLGIEKASCASGKFNAYRGELPKGTQFVMLHTRLATQGDPSFPKNNHPVVNGDIFVTHNGHIANDYELWAEIGYINRMAQVDSEVIPAVVAQKGWESYKDALTKLTGSMAIAMANHNAPGELILAKGEFSPLWYVENRDLIVWASTREAISHAWRAAIGTPPKVIDTLTTGQVLEIKDGVLSKTTFKVTFDDRYWMNQYNTTGKNVKVFEIKDGKTTNADMVGGYKGSSKNLSTRTDLKSWGWDDQDILEYEDALKEDHDSLRVEADEILASGNDWWRDEKILAHFNGLWDRIREIKDELEELAWEQYDPDQEDDEDLTGAMIHVQCPSCLESYPLSEMDDSGDALYCTDCWDFWIKSTKGEDGGTTYEALFDSDGKPIPPGLLDVDGKPIPGY